MPTFGKDYDVGWAGFTFYPADVLSEAIAYGERAERRQAISRLRWGAGKIVPVSHAFICTGDGTGIEAHMETGVAEFKISKYADDPKCKLYFRRPIGWTPEIGSRAARLAHLTPPLHCPYDMRLIDALAVNYSLTGCLLNLVTRNRFKRIICRLANEKNHFICSMTVASIYQQIPDLDRRGCLRHPACTIDPQELFDDDKVFDCRFGLSWNYTGS